jgi:hypothetical protein
LTSATDRPHSQPHTCILRLSVIRSTQRFVFSVARKDRRERRASQHAVEYYNYKFKNTFYIALWTASGTMQSESIIAVSSRTQSFDRNTSRKENTWQTKA